MSTYNPVTEEVLEALREALGAENVKVDEETLDRYKTDEETDPRYHHLPEVVVLPGSTEEVAEVMKIANKYLVPVTPRSNCPESSVPRLPLPSAALLLQQSGNHALSSPVR